MAPTSEDFSALFVGINLEPLFLEKIDPSLYSLFKPYLEEVQVGPEAWLGKCLTEPITLEELEQLQAHITSLIKKFVAPHTSIPPLFCKALQKI